MHELTLATVFIAGLLGSTHCVTMCGGIATALGARATGGAGRWQPLIYQFGRISSYGIAGAIVGTLGTAAGAAFAITRWSQILRLATALVVVVIGLDIALATSGRGRWLRAPERLGAVLWRRIAPAARIVLPAPPGLRALTLGLLWGWLPCGLVYSALLAAAVAGSTAGGGATMIAFGLGTLPAMLGLNYAGTHLPRPDGSLARLLGSIIVVCGLWTASVPIAQFTGSTRHNAHTMAMPTLDSAAQDHPAMTMP